MAVVACELHEFVRWGYSGREWYWGKLAKRNTYIIIFSRTQMDERRMFDVVKHQVNILLDEDNCHNTVHPNTSSNRIVVFELPVKMGPAKPRKPRVKSSKVQSVPELPL